MVKYFPLVDNDDGDGDDMTGPLVPWEWQSKQKRQDGPEWHSIVRSQTSPASPDICPLSRSHIEPLSVFKFNIPLWTPRSGIWTIGHRSVRSLECSCYERLWLIIVRREHYLGLYTPCFIRALCKRKTIIISLHCRWCKQWGKFHVSWRLKLRYQCPDSLYLIFQ